MQSVILFSLNFPRQLTLSSCCPAFCRPVLRQSGLLCLQLGRLGGAEAGNGALTFWHSLCLFSSRRREKPCGRWQLSCSFFPERLKGCVTNKMEPNSPSVMMGAPKSSSQCIFFSFLFFFFWRLVSHSLAWCKSMIAKDNIHPAVSATPRVKIFYWPMERAIDNQFTQLTYFCRPFEAEKRWLAAAGTVRQSMTGTEHKRHCKSLDQSVTMESCRGQRLCEIQLQANTKQSHIMKKKTPKCCQVIWL